MGVKICFLFDTKYYVSGDLIRPKALDDTFLVHFNPNKRLFDRKIKNQHIIRRSKYCYKFF